MADERTCLAVKGLCCETEARVVTRALTGVPGVDAVDVDLLGKRVWVKHQGGVSPSVLLDALTPLELGASLTGVGAPASISTPQAAGRRLSLPIVGSSEGSTKLDHPRGPDETHEQGRPEPRPEGALTPGSPAPPLEDADDHDDGPSHGHEHGESEAGMPWRLIATGVLVGASMLESWIPHAEWAALGAVALGLPPVARKGWAAVRHRVLDINFLMTVAVLGALAIGEWGEGATVGFLFAVAEWLEDRAMDRARSAIAAVMKLAPETAILADGREVPAAEVAVGARLLVRPGARIALDGRVIAGDSAVDESALTGESVPVAKRPGAAVSAGTVNQAGVLEVEVTAVAGDSAVARLARLVEEAQAARSPTERWVDRFARIYTPVVCVIALGIAVIPVLLGEEFRPWLYRALVLLVVACPCALVLSTPVTIVSALARAARAGVLIKGGVHLEALGQLRALAMDKTGTLTEGRFRVVDCVPLNGVSEAELHRVVAAVESRSSHPLAGALREHAADGAEIPGAATYETIEGEGVVATVEGRTVHVGNHRMAQRLGLHDEAEHTRLEAWMAAGRTVVYVAIDGKLAGHLSLADVPRAEAKDAVAALESGGVRLAILTGDNAGTAGAVARAVGIRLVHADLLPKGKVDALRELRRAHGSVGMVGDGINDGPALAAADVGIAMGTRGTAVALEAADVALMGDDLRRLAWAVGLGRAALARVKLNVTLAIGAKGIVMVLAVLGIANLWIAVAADMGVSLVVITLGLGLLRYPEPFAPSRVSVEGTQ